MKKLRLALIAVLMFAAQSVFAMVDPGTDEVEGGKVYQFIHIWDNLALQAGDPDGYPGSGTPDAGKISQYWLVEELYAAADTLPPTYAIRSLANGKYLKSSQAAVVNWQYADNTNLLATKMCIRKREDSNYFVISSFSQRNYQWGAMVVYGDGIICYNRPQQDALWALKEVNLPQEEIDRLLALAKSKDDVAGSAADYQTALNEFFADAACTELKAPYNTLQLNKIRETDSYLALPEPLQLAVDKAKEGLRWVEYNSRKPASDENAHWDVTRAKKFRVQLYEPYSDHGQGANAAGISAWSATNNPTGIVAGIDDLLYVMVDEEPAEGSQLSIGGLDNKLCINDSKKGVRLHKGLNIVPFYSDLDHIYIFYTVDTYDNNKKEFLNKLSAYHPIKIHIEGGRINGFFNYVGDALYPADDNWDWDNMYKKNYIHPMFDLVGKNVIMHMSMVKQHDNNEGTGPLYDGLYDIIDTEKYDLAELVGAWDNVVQYEKLLAGLTNDADIADPFAGGYYESIHNDDIAPAPDYSEYLNNRVLAVTDPGSTYMHASWGHTAYKPSTHPDILLGLPYVGGNVWGPAHEIGHTNQGPIKMMGTTEISNNLFSNAVTYQMGLQTSWEEMPSEQLKHFNAKDHYLKNDLFGCTRMYFQLWCYYHALGHNKKFYPRLFQLLREQPLTQDRNAAAAEDQLHFARMACIAAQEDLTDFFDSWGFLFPMTYSGSDYGDFTITVTQQEIDDFRKEIAAMNLPKNRAIITFDDRVGSSIPSSQFNKYQAGEMGGFPDHEANSRSDGKYYYRISGNKATIKDGTGGVGFLAYDRDGRLKSFSNSRSFNLSDEARDGLNNGTVSLYSVDADGTLHEMSDKPAPTTGITGISADSAPAESDVIYDISGRRLRSIDAPGIYIVNGKKRLVTK